MPLGFHEQYSQHCIVESVPARQLSDLMKRSRSIWQMSKSVRSLCIVDAHPHRAPGIDATAQVGDSRVERYTPNGWARDVVLACQAVSCSSGLEVAHF